MEKVDQMWKILQLHDSVPDARVRDGDTSPTETAMQNTIEAWISDLDINPDLSEDIKFDKLREYLAKAQEIMTDSKSIQIDCITTYFGLIRLRAVLQVLIHQELADVDVWGYPLEYFAQLA